jgi:hypothetical protein
MQYIFLLISRNIPISLSSTMTEHFKGFPWIDPWVPVSDRGRDAYNHELKMELGLDHPLYGVRTAAVARTRHTDDILFQLYDHPVAGFAVVHLTFRGRPEPAPQWPSVVLYRDVEHWVTQRMLRDAAAFEIDQSNQAA